MSNTQYRYTGPNSAVTLKVDDGAGGLKDQDVILWNGQNVELPSGHAVTQALEHQGFLTPVAGSIAQGQAPNHATTQASAQQADQVLTLPVVDKPSATNTTKAK